MQTQRKAAAPFLRRVLTSVPGKGPKPLADTGSNTAQQRRLATIVAIDVAGYSARAEADETAAAAAIAALSRRVHDAAETHGGRVFNTAGDGFMLEFPTVTGALEAAEAIAADPDTPVRAGVHLGEVMVTPTGDLLGHGVNVAARIQALAPARGVLVSDDVRRALRGPLAERLADRGLARLDKMDETVRIFALTDQRRAKARALRLPRRRTLQVLAALLLVALLAAAATTWMLRARLWPDTDRDTRVAVLPFKVAGADPQTRVMADGLAEEITGVLSSNQMLTVAASPPPAATPGAAAGAAAATPTTPAATPDAAFVLEGSVERDGPTLQVRVRLTNPDTRVTLWSETFSGQADDPAGLQTEVAAKATDAVSFALDARRKGGAALDDTAMADFIQGNILLSFGSGAVKARAVLLRVVARAPGFARGHSALAVACSLIVRKAPRDQREPFRREVRDQAAQALKLDPTDGEAYLALNYAAGDDTAWSLREGYLQRGLALEPGFAYLNNNYSYLLADVGRPHDALGSIQRGLAANALHPGANYRYATALAQVGRYGEAREAIDLLARKWPRPWTDGARLALVMVYGPPADARALLARSRAHAYAGQGPLHDAWAAFLDARQTRDPARRKRAAAMIMALAGAPSDGALHRSDAILALNLLGDLDDAFALAGRGYSDDGDFSAFALYAPPTAPMRADPRFWPLAAQLRLLDYWRTSGRWPDFCDGLKGAESCQARAAQTR
ncbi:MAG: hypothetical protein JWP35_2900 [Caulobacter sp.]|nr:hypothetical protein [Caulobacter sp.]